MVLEIDSLIGSSHELLRLAKKWNPNFSEKLKILEDDSIDKAYKAVVLSLVARTQKNDQNGRRKKKSHTNNKGKKMKDKSKHTGLNIDPDYELFSKHFKKRDNSFRLQYGKGGPVVVVQYEGDIESEKERGLEVERRREVSNALVVVHEKIPENQAPRRLTRGYLRKYGQLDQVHGVENQYKNNPQPVLVKNTSNINNVVRADGPRSVDMPKGWRVVNEKILEKHDWSIGGFKRKYGTSDQMDAVGNQHKRDSQYILVKKKGITDMVECIGGPRNVLQNERRSAIEFREAKPEECFMEYGEDKSDSEVVILDEAACFKKGALNPFVPSKRFDISTQEDGILLNGGSSETNVFRKEVLDDLNKPYDREEYKRLAKEVKNRRYLESHPDLGRKFKLEKYKFNRRRRLALLRGFFFWLQNLTREGSFKPWKDRACLAVEPPYP